MGELKQSKRKSSLKDVADIVGLSVSSVSQILNNKVIDFSSEKTKEKVRQVAKELGYKQKFAHQLIRGEVTKTVALVLSLARLEQEEYIQKLLYTLSTSYNKQGYATYIYRLNLDNLNNIEIINSLAERGVAKFIFIGTPLNRHELIAQVEKLKCQWVSFGNFDNIAGSIHLDTASGVEKIINHLQTKNIKNFKIMCHKTKEDARYEGLKRYFSDLSEEELEKYCCFFRAQTESSDSIEIFDKIGEKATEDILQDNPNIEAIIYFSDYYVTGGIRSLLRHKKVIGKDIIIAGINNIHAIKTSPYPVISLETDIENLSNLLMENVNKKDKKFIKIHHKLILREEVTP